MTQLEKGARVETPASTDSGVELSASTDSGVEPSASTDSRVEPSASTDSRVEPSASEAPVSAESSSSGLDPAPNQSAILSQPGLERFLPQPRTLSSVTSTLFPILRCLADFEPAIAMRFEPQTLSEVSATRLTEPPKPKFLDKHDELDRALTLSALLYQIQLRYPTNMAFEITNTLLYMKVENIDRLAVDYESLEKVCNDCCRYQHKENWITLDFLKLFPLSTQYCMLESILRKLVHRLCPDFTDDIVRFFLRNFTPESLFKITIEEVSTLESKVEKIVAELKSQESERQEAERAENNRIQGSDSSKYGRRRHTAGQSNTTAAAAIPDAFSGLPDLVEVAARPKQNQKRTQDSPNRSRPRQEAELVGIPVIPSRSLCRRKQGSSSSN